MNTDQLVKRVFLGLTFLFVVFIMYASWTPGTQSIEGVRRQFSGIDEISDVFRVHDLRDVATNVLLYIPLGVFLALSRRKPKILSPWLALGFGVSLAMEFGQTFIGRHPDVVDLVTNTAGYIIGYLVVAVGVSVYGLNAMVLLGLDPDSEQDTRTQSIAAIRFIYISIYVLVALLPFDVSVSLSRLYEQLLPDDDGRVRIILDPFHHLSLWQDHGLKLTLELLGLVPVAVLTALLGGLKGRLSLFAAVFTCLLVAVCCEIAQVFILSRTTDMAMVVLAVIAGALGWGLVRVWFNLQHAEVSAAAPGAAGRNWRPVAVAAIGYGLVILFFAWSPFRFELELRTVAAKVLHETNIFPFREHFATRDLGSAIDIVKETLLFVPLGVLLSYLLYEIAPGLTRLNRILLAAVVCGLFATFTELSQAVCIGRYIDITDILLAGFGGLCGAVMLGVFRRGAVGRPSKSIS
jgi:glycopeptide antibiotics resistance protein